jgi:hypothetical protein
MIISRSQGVKPLLTASNLLTRLMLESLRTSFSARLIPSRRLLRFLE